MKKLASRTKEFLRRTKKLSSSASSTVDHHQPSKEEVAACPSSDPAAGAVDGEEPTSVLETSVTLVEAVNTKSSPTNEIASEAGEVEATDPKSLWDLAYDALREEKLDVVEAYEALLDETGSYLADASS